ncbi:MAG: NAD(P)/FAD-dependent oxidoreductase [Polyangiaceae bacterium]
MRRAIRDWDVIVIGSGAGGLTAAAALARNGQRVLVLEQHYLPGGWSQSFALSGYRFSPGVHYVGECGPGGFLRRLYEGLGLTGDLEMCEMNPDGFDHLLLGEHRFDVPRGYDRLVERMIARFPREEAGLRRYFAVLRQLAGDVARVDELFRFPRVLALPFIAPSLVRWGLCTQRALLDATVQDPLLRGFLAAQNGDHGLAPSRISLPAHACLVQHYADGAYYPRGGARSIPRALVKALRRHGGGLRLRSRVARILTERGRVAGVELLSGERIYARHVISNADPYVTYNRLLPPELCPREREKSRKMKYSVSLLSVFAVVDMDLRARGYDSGNYWWYPTADVHRMYERSEVHMPDGAIDGLFLAIPTLKDPSHGYGGTKHTLEMFTFVPYEPFSVWEGTAPGRRGPEYEALKEGLADRMIAAAEHVIPGISRAIVLREVGTPLTNEFYCESPFGNTYGTAKTPFQLGPFSYRTEGELGGLHLCGASTLSHGVAGASISGLMAAQRILGLSSREELLGPADGSLRVYPSEHPEEWVSRVAREKEEEAREDTLDSAQAPM